MESSVLDEAAYFGQHYPVIEPKSAELRSIFGSVREALEKLDTVHDYSALSTFCSKEIWPSPVATSFFLKMPVSLALGRLSQNLHPLTESIEIYPFLHATMNAGYPVDRVAACVTFQLERHVDDCSDACVLLLCNLLQRFADDSFSRKMLHKDELFQRLHFRMVRRATTQYKTAFMTLLCSLVLSADMIHTSFDSVTCIVESACLSLTLSSTPTALSLVCECAKQIEWHSRLCMFLISTVKVMGWQDSCAQIYLHMIHGASVQFLLDVVNLGLFESLLEATRTKKSHHWKHMYDLLTVLWPSKVNQYETTVVISRPSSTTYECPLTLVPCTYPVVASDGHTYEMDALLTHMSQSGYWSPMTRQPISCIVFRNRCLSAY